MKFIYILLIINIIINCCNSNEVGNLCVRCLKLDDKCNSLGLCAKDLVCSSKTKQFNNKPQCMLAVEEDSICQNSEQCFLGLKCKFINENLENGTCSNIHFAQVNENCNEDFDCSGKDLKCINSKCVRNKEKQCGLDNPCEFGEYCSMPSRQCAKLSKENEICKFSVECPLGTFCDTNSNKCKRVFSLKEGDKCQAYSNDQCDPSSGAYCGTSGVCEKFDLSSPGECFTTTNLCAPLHRCSCSDFKCHPTRLLGKEFSKSVSNFYDCANKHKCQFTINRFSPKSCITQHCAPEFCKFNLALTPDNELNCGRIPVKNYCQRYSNFKDDYQNNNERPNSSVNNNHHQTIQKSKSNLVLSTITIPIAILIISIVVEIRLRKREKNY